MKTVLDVFVEISLSTFLFSAVLSIHNSGFWLNVMLVTAVNVFIILCTELLNLSSSCSVLSVLL